MNTKSHPERVQLQENGHMLTPKGHDNEMSSLPRKRAEEMNRESKSCIPEDTKKLSSEEMQRVLHELQVHQIELKMQNEELRRSQEELNLALARYFDLYDDAPVGYCTVSDKGIILEANLTVANLLGVPKGMLVKQLFSRFIVREDQDTYYLHHKQLFEIGKPLLLDLRMVKENGTLFWAHLVAKAEKKDHAASVCRIVLSDITEHKEYEDERELTSRLIVLVNAPGDFHQLMSELTKSLQGWSGCEAVGIRLSEGDYFPYYETRGFPPVFVQEEKHLCTHGADGAVLRNNVGRPILDCMCGNVLSGRFDPSKPFFTDHGSFWSNNTTAMLASTTEADRQSRTRNRCNGEGYESVALIPLRAGNQVFGLLQFNDHRTNRFTRDLISHLEKIADSLAVALSRRQAEERLHESEENMRYIVRHDPNAIAIYDRNLHYIAVSERYLHDYNVKEKDIIGKHHYEVFPEMPRKWKDVHQRCLAGAIERNDDDYFERPDGSITYNRWECRPWRRGDGEIGGIITYTEVTTERKKTEIALRESEELFRTLADNIPDIVARFDLQLRHLYVNPNIEKLTGKPVKAFIGKTNRELGMPLELAELWEQASRKALETGETVQIEFNFPTNDGLRFFESRLIPEKDKDGRTVSMLSLARDITERKAAEIALREAENRYHLLFRQSPDGIVIIDPATGRFLEFNETAHRQLGYSREEFAGLGITDIEAEETPEETRLRIDTVMREGRCDFDTRQRTKQGEIRDVHVTALFTEISGRTVYHCVWRDITERKRSEEALQENERKLSNLITSMEQGLAIHKIILDKNGVPVDYRFLDVNPAFERLTGMKKEAIIGKTVLELLPNTEKMWIEKYGHVALTGESIHIENYSRELGKYYEVTAYRTEPETFATIVSDITVRKRAEEALRENRANLDAALASMTDAVFISDANGHFIEFNEAFATFHRFRTKSECARRLADYPDIIDVFMPNGELAPMNMWAVTRALRGETGTNVEYTLRRKDSGETWVGSYSFSPIRNKDGVIVGSVVVGRDITERKRTEEQILRNEKHLKGLVSILQYRADTTQEFLDNALDEAIKLTDSKIGYIYFYNEDTKQFVLNTWSKDVMKECSVINPQTCYELDKTGVWGEAVRQRKVIIINDFHGLNPLRKGYPKGHVHLTRFMTVPVFREDRIVAVVGVANKARDYDDVDVLQLSLLMEAVWKCVEIKKGEDALRDSEQRFRSFIENASDIVFGMTPEGVFTYLSPNWQELIGEPAADAIGKSFEFYVHPTDIQLCRNFLEEIGKDAQRFNSVDYRVLRRDGTVRWHSFKGKAIRGRDGGVTGYIGISRDITEHKWAEEEKSKLEIQLRESQKMQAVGQLAGGISHDFNNLLSVINGYAQMLLKGGDFKAAERTKIREILRAGELASSLTRQLLVFSRRQPMEAKVIDLNAIVSGMNKMLRRIVNESIAISTVAEPELWRIKADPAQLEQVIMNLVVNGGDAMPDGGKLTIKTENVEVDDSNRAMHHPDIKPGSYAVLSVADTGCGMDDKVKGHIFEPFFTTKEIGKGTGLGLAIIYGIVKQCNAYIDVQSELGKGTTFRIYFPIAGRETKSDEESKKLSPIPGGNETILLVEDEAIIRDLLHEFLQSVGYKVLSSGNAVDALELAGRHKGVIHLMLTDIVMPGMNGFELAKKLRKSLPKTKLLFMSGYAKPTDTHGMIRMTDNLINKPISIYDLAIKLREILDE